MFKIQDLFSLPCEMTKSAIQENLPSDANILITGGSGVVGLHLCQAFVQAGIIPDNIKLTYFTREITALKKIFLGVNFIKYNSIELLKDESFDVIIHCATYGQPLLYTHNQLDTLALNTAHQFKLFTKLKKSGYYGFLSSSDIYDGNYNFPLSENELGISDPWSERACYFEGKRAGEAIINAAVRSGRQAKAFRLALGYGAGFSNSDQRVLYQFVKAAILNGQIRMRDSGNAKRTYGSLVDCARMIILGLLSGQHRVYNIGGVSRCSILDLANQIGKIARVEVISGPQIPESKVLQAAPSEVWLDLTRILNEFPLELEPLNSGLSRVLKWASQKDFFNDERS